MWPARQARSPAWLLSCSMAAKAISPSDRRKSALDDSGGLADPRGAYLSGLAALSGRTRRSHWRRRFLAHLLASGPWRADRVARGPAVLALRFAGFHLGGGLSPVVRLPALRSPP